MWWMTRRAPVHYVVDDAAAIRIWQVLLHGAAEANATSIFVGNYSDPKHPGCLREVAGEGTDPRSVPAGSLLIVYWHTGTHTFARHVIHHLILDGILYTPYTLHPLLTPFTPPHTSLIHP